MSADGECDTVLALVGERFRRVECAQDSLLSRLTAKIIIFNNWTLHITSLFY